MTRKLRPCLMLMGDTRLSVLAVDDDAARDHLDVYCRVNDLERTGAILLWDDVAVAQGWDAA